MPDRTWRPGALISDRYRLESQLGHGGFGVVWKATDIEHEDRTVAIKVLRPLGPGFSEAPAERAKALREHHSRFLREAEQASALSDGPHIITIHEWDEHEGRPYMVMSYVEGVSLGDLLATGPMAPTRAVAVLDQVCDALSFTHDRLRIHRDVKPSNVLVETVDGIDAVHLVDFGAVGGINEDVVPRVTRTGAGAPGSMPYMSPERFKWDHEGRPVAPPRPTFDVYALGCVLYECLTGMRAFHGPHEVTFAEVHEHQYRPRPSDSGHPAAASFEPFDGVVIRALAVDPNRRTPTAGMFAEQMRAALAEWVDEREDRSVTVPPPTRVAAPVGAGSAATVEPPVVVAPVVEPPVVVERPVEVAAIAAVETAQAVGTTETSQAPEAPEAVEVVAASPTPRRDGDAPTPTSGRPLIMSCGAAAGIVGSVACLPLGIGAVGDVAVIAGCYVVGAVGGWVAHRARSGGRVTGPGVSTRPD